jgi:protein PhnA|tara:strand:+ start:3622 stop:4194 length:573 start_codon:yes stop_codon:yes gene_type:complete
MSVESELESRSEGKCEMCGDTNGLKVYDIPPIEIRTANKAVFACNTCWEQMDNPDDNDENHWRCLNDSMWSETDAIKVMAWRMLTRLNNSWTQNLLDMMYLEDDILKWAKASGEGVEGMIIIHKDSNGVMLNQGDSIVLIKDLDVKGAGFTAKRGTPVRNINLVNDNPEHIEGKVNGQRIVILTQFVKKS